MSIARAIEKRLTTLMNHLANIIGKPQVFAAVFVILLSWFVAGLFLEYQTWFDIMDLTIFLSTFFLLFVVQSSQNADTRAIQDKFDDIIAALPKTDKTKEKEEKRMKRGDKT